MKAIKWSRILLLLVIIASFLPVYLAYKHTRNITIETQRHAAEAFSEMMSQFRDFYSSEVLSKMQNLPVRVSHEYSGIEDALPLPASMVFDLAERINHAEKDFKLFIVSEYPFPWRYSKPLDDFEKKALEQFAQLGRESYDEVRKFEGEDTLYYASPIRMKQSCVDCHNSHPDSPKTDWKTGDVRGLQIITFPLSAIEHTSMLGLAYLVTFIIFAFIIGNSLVIWFYNKQQMAIAGLKLKSNELDFFKRALEEHAIVTIYDRDRKIKYANNQLNQISGYTKDELIGKSADIFLPEDDDYNVFQFNEMWETVMSGQTWHGDIKNINRNGDVFWVSATVVPFMNDTGQPFQFVSVQTDISTRIMAEQESVFAREEAEKANLAKSEFLSSMSHELRTPLNAIIGFSELISYDETLTADLQENAGEISKAGHHLLTLINEILDLSKIESGNMSLELETVSVAELAGECYSLIDSIAEKHQITVINEVTGNLGVRADYMRLKQVLLNLLSNAIKYNRENGQVTIKAERTPDMQRVRITITDTGIGIADKDLKKLFKPFSRLAENQMTVEGTGIGLTITKKIVEMMYGQINFDSTVGVGSSFWIEMPYVKPVEKVANTETDIPVEAEAVYAEKRRVLYIEDNPANVKLVEKILSEIGFIDYEIAMTPQEGIQLAAHQRPHLILLDINLPDMNGYEVLNILRMNRKLANTRVFAVTANAMPSDLEKGEKAGFDDYLTKPLNVNEFIKKVKKALSETAE